MEQAPELTDITRRIYEAISRGDADLLDQVLSHHQGLVFIGTDPTEWWEDRAPLRQALAAQAAAGITAIPGRIRAYREGSVGWVADQPTFQLPDGTALPARITAVYHQEHGGWRLVQAHTSIGAGNQETIGTDLSTR